MKPTVIFMLFLGRLVEFTLTLKECSKLPLVQHAFVLDEYKRTEYQRGDVIYFCCDPGFTTGLNTTYICTEHGWRAATIGQCVEDSFHVLLGCTPPPPLTNGYLLQSTDLIYTNGQTARYRCDDHHIMSGGMFKTCTNGQWTGDIQCIPVTCNVSADPPLGTTYNPQDRIIFTPGESVTVTCGEKLWVKSTELQTAQLFCKSTGRTGIWDFNPVCQPVKCLKDDPLVYRWERIRERYYPYYYRTSADIDETSWYECQRGLEAAAEDSRARCTRRGWEPNPLCEG